GSKRNLILVGYTNGFQIWDTIGDDKLEELISWRREGICVTDLLVLEPSQNLHAKFKNPLIALIGYNLDNSPQRKRPLAAEIFPPLDLAGDSDDEDGKPEKLNEDQETDALSPSMVRFFDSELCSFVHEI